MTKFSVSSLIFIVVSLGCAQSPKIDAISKSERLQNLSKQASTQREKNEKIYLAKLIQDVKIEAKLKKYKTYSMPQSATDESLYKEVIQSYQTRDPERLEFFAEKHVQLFPSSIFADNTLFLLGQLQLATGQAGESLRTFDRLLNDYPLGNKRASAMLGKGVAFRKLGFRTYANNMFDEVKKSYPGSAEYYRVDLEKKLLSVDKESQ